MRRMTLLAGVALFLAHPALAGEIENACLKSERSGGQRALCGCIQDAANMTLTPRDQKRAAEFFEDPHRAQEVRQSGSRRDSDFWERYKNFGETAQIFCSR